LKKYEKDTNQIYTRATTNAIFDTRKGLKDRQTKIEEQSLEKTLKLKM